MSHYSYNGDCCSDVYYTSLERYMLKRLIHIIALWPPPLSNALIMQWTMVTCCNNFKSWSGIAPKCIFHPCTSLNLWLWAAQVKLLLLGSFWLSKHFLQNLTIAKSQVRNLWQKMSRIDVEQQVSDFLNWVPFTYYIPLPTPLVFIKK